MPGRQATSRVATSDITPLRRRPRIKAGLALAVPVIDQSLRKRLNRRAGKLDAGKFPAVSLKMNTYPALAFRVAEADQKFDGLYRRQPAQHLQHAGGIDVTEAPHIRDPASRLADGAAGEDAGEIFGRKH